MTARKDPTKKSHIGLTLMVLIVSVIAAGVSWGYGTYARLEEENRELPKLALATIVRDLRAYHKASGRFPETFEQLDEKRRVEGRNYELNGRALSMANYFYVLTAVDVHRATVWAVPAGPRRDEAATQFIVVEPSDLVVWKGAAIPIADVGSIHGNPTRSELAALGLIEQPSAKREKGNR